MPVHQRVRLEGWVDLFRKEIDAKPLKHESITSPVELAVAEEHRKKLGVGERSPGPGRPVDVAVFS